MREGTLKSLNLFLTSFKKITLLYCDIYQCLKNPRSKLVNFYWFYIKMQKKKFFVYFKKSKNDTYHKNNFPIYGEDIVNNHKCWNGLWSFTLAIFCQRMLYSWVDKVRLIIISRIIHIIWSYWNYLNYVLKIIYTSLVMLAVLICDLYINYKNPYCTRFMTNARDCEGNWNELPLIIPKATLYPK